MFLDFPHKLFEFDKNHPCNPEMNLLEIEREAAQKGERREREKLHTERERERERKLGG